MKRFKKLLVPLELNDSDSSTIAWAGKVSQMAGSEEVLFVHATDVAELPETATQKYPWLMEPLDDVLEKRMQELVSKFWKGREGIDQQFKVLKKRSPVFGVLNEVFEQESDLVVVGRSEEAMDLSLRLARKSDCSVMVVPEGASVKLRSIVTATDFSDLGKVAIDIAEAFALKEGLKSIFSLNITGTGKMSHRMTIPQEELEKMTVQFADEKHETYLSTIDNKGIELKRCTKVHGHVASGVSAFVRENDIDMIIAGCRGKDTITSMFLGSNAEEILKSANVPVIAAKVKGRGRSFLAELFNV